MTFVDTLRSIKALMTRGGTSHLDAVGRLEQNRLLCIATSVIPGLDLDKETWSGGTARQYAFTHSSGNCVL